MKNPENHDLVQSSHGPGNHQDKKLGPKNFSGIQSNARSGTQVNSNQNQMQKEAPLSEGRLKETVKEIGGPKGPEPTRFGDWERKGRCIDF